MKIRFLKILAFAVLVLMAMTACPTEPGKEGKSGRDGRPGKDGVNGVDGIDIPITLWTCNFPILLEDRTGGKLTETDVNDIQRYLTNLETTTWQTGQTVRNTITTRANGNIRMIIEDVDIYPQDTWIAPAQDADFNSQGHYWAEDGRTVHIRYARLKDPGANKYSLIANAMARTVQTDLPDLSKK